MYCTQCGQKNEDTVKYCLSCGSVMCGPITDSNFEGNTTSYAFVKQKKPYRAEYTLGLVGAIIASVLFFFIGIFALLELAGEMGPESYYNNYVEGLFVLTALLWLISFIFGYVGIGQINRLNLNGGTFLIVGACLGLICMFLTPAGIFALLYWPLLLSGGITALGRKSHLKKLGALN